MHQYSKKAYRPNNESWEDELMADYDSSSIELYYKDSKLSCSTEFKEQFIKNTLGAEDVYIAGDIIVIIRFGKIHTTSGDLIYTQEISQLEELQTHIGAICTAWCAYNQAGDDAIAYFEANKESFPLLDTQEIKQIFPGEWVMYYTHADELSVTYASNGEYTEHYKSSNPVYAWDAVDGILCERKLSNNEWWYKYTVRKIEDNIYLLYELNGSFYCAMEKVG